MYTNALDRHIPIINLSKKGRSIEELAASRREYHREYRRRRKEQRCI